MRARAIATRGLDVARPSSRRIANRLSVLIEADPATPLIAAARKGDTSGVERLLLQNGADRDRRDARGRTALHYAAARGHAETAACLLAYGADHRLRDHKGRTALGPRNVSLRDLHAIRQRYHRFRRDDASHPATSAQAQAWGATLAARGIVKLSGLIAGDVLTCLQSDFAVFARNLEERVARGEAVKRHYFEEEHWWPNDAAFVTNNAFRYSAALARFACTRELLECARLYLGTPPVVQRAVAMRYLPRRSAENDMFAWHHDLEERRFKVMILLTDVGPCDQHMSYVIGSHALFHPYRMFLRNTCDLAYCRRHLPRVEVYDATGNAGDVFLFDTNGAHRGVRREEGRVRDVYLVEYNASTANVWGGDVAPSVVDGIRGHDPFAAMAVVPRKWTRPVTQTTPSWVVNLPDVDSWL